MIFYGKNLENFLNSLPGGVYNKGKIISQKRLKMFTKQMKNKGFYLIGLLIALVIIMILVGYQMGGNKKENLPPAKTQIDRGKAAACTANRRALETQIQMWMIQHPGETPTIEKLKQARISIPRCPAGGTYSITPEGKVVCSIHGQ